jgi:hypothetical protein
MLPSNATILLQSAVLLLYVYLPRLVKETPGAKFSEQGKNMRTGLADGGCRESSAKAPSPPA